MHKFFKNHKNIMNFANFGPNNSCCTALKTSKLRTLTRLAARASITKVSSFRNVNDSCLGSNNFFKTLQLRNLCDRKLFLVLRFCFEHYLIYGILMFCSNFDNLNKILTLMFRICFGNLNKICA